MNLEEPICQRCLSPSLIRISTEPRGYSYFCPFCVSFTDDPIDRLLAVSTSWSIGRGSERRVTPEFMELIDLCKHTTDRSYPIIRQEFLKKIIGSCIPEHDDVRKVVANVTIRGKRFLLIVFNNAPFRNSYTLRDPSCPVCEQDYRTKNILTPMSIVLYLCNECDVASVDEYGMRFIPLGIESVLGVRGLNPNDFVFREEFIFELQESDFL